MCPLCDDTGWKPVEAAGVRRVVRCDCWREGLTTRLLEDARIPPRYRRCDLETFVTYPNEKLLGAVAQARRFADDFPEPRKGLCLIGPPGIGKTHLAVAVLRRVILAQRRARALLRRARSAARDPQHLQPARPHGGDGHPPAGDGSRPARARRPRLREDVRVGRRDDEPDRQHALQRAAAHDLHVELRRHAGRRRSGLPARRGSGSASTRGCTRCASSSSTTAPTTGTCRRMAGSRIS